MTTRKNWTEFDRLVVLGLYCELPFGQFHERHPRIIGVAQKLERSPGSVAMKLSNLASLDPIITGSGRKGLPGASQADRDLWQEFSEQPSKVMPQIATALQNLDKVAAENSEIIKLDDYRGETATAIIQRRKSQNLFRKAVLSAYDNQCCITGITDSRLLVASHIKPWAEDEQNRLNPRNGLCLSTFFDRAFDTGLITFSNDFALMVSSELEQQQSNNHIRETFIERSGTAIELPSKFSPSPDFMRWHRESLFIQ